MKFEVQFRGSGGAKATRLVEFARAEERWQVTLDGQRVDADPVEVAPNTFSILLHGRAYEMRVSPAVDGSLMVQTATREFSVEVLDPRAWRGRHPSAEAEGRQQIVAPMPGKVVRLLVKEGDMVDVGQGLLVVEAMKMQNEIRSPKNGRIERLIAKEGQLVNAGETLAWVD
ncbi:MAG: acetyl-CoA carboxylase biotin carboxyl carrier protein subunit [Candidatus Acidiferrum sp.]